MSNKLLTLKELAEYLKVREEDVLRLVDEKVIQAYNLGGEVLRFRKEQIDATYDEISSRIKGVEKLVDNKGTVPSSPKRARIVNEGTGPGIFRDSLFDFFYFNDFYIISGIIILILLVIIFRG